MANKNRESENDPIQRCIGAFGRYQVFICFLVFLTKFFISMHQLAIVFLNPPVNYVCADNNVQNHCPCTNPVFDRSIFTETISTKWKLICYDRFWMGSFNQTIFMTGSLIGSLMFGTYADRYGRRLTLIIAVLIQMTSSVAAAFVPDYYSFTVLRFITGAAIGGTMVIGFVILAEFISKRYIAILAAVYQIPFNIGHILLSVISYFLRDYRYFQFTLSFPAVAMLIYFCYLPETPRWLIAMRRTNDAVKVLERAAKFNKMPTDVVRPNVIAYQTIAEKHSLKKGTILDLFKTPNIRKNIIVISIQWLSCSYSFYGISQYIGALSGDIFLNTIFGALFTFVGTLLSMPAMMYLGRRTIVIVFNLVCALSLLGLAFMPVGVAKVVCAVIGEMASFIVFVLVYLYTTELFPTVVRNASVGFSSMLARLGAMIAPFVVDTKVIHPMLPPLLFGIIPLIAGLAAFLLPETKGHMFMTTIAEGEAFKAPNWLDAKVPHTKPPEKSFLESLMCWK